MLDLIHGRALPLDGKGLKNLIYKEKRGASENNSS